MPSFRPRFSILTALLLMTILAMAIVLARLWREVGPLRPEVKDLRQRVGVLTIADPSVIQAVGLPSETDDVYKWRIHVPTNQNATLLVKCGDVPRTGYPDADLRRILISEGENLVTIKGRSFEGEYMSLEAQIHGNDDSTISLPQVSGPLTGVFQGDGLWSEQTTMDSSNKLLLLRKRYAPPGQNSALANDAPLPGFIIWLEPR
jgi:hypothetical protein